MREFSVRGAGTALTADAADLTGYVSSYVPSDLFKMTVNDAGNALFAISSRNVTGGTDYRAFIPTNTTGTRAVGLAGPVQLGLLGFLGRGRGSAGAVRP